MAPTRTRSDARACLSRGRAGRRTRVWLAPLLLAAIGFAPVVLRPYPDGPPPGHTGGFGEPTCQVCHTPTTVDTIDGWLGLDGAPAAYDPGKTYRLTVSVGRASLGAAGFQMSVRHLGGSAPGTDAGQLRSLDARTRVVRVDSTGVSYAQHTETGFLPLSEESSRWSIEWTAPGAGAGPVAFDFAANAADGDASEFGDWIRSGRRITKPKGAP